MWDEPDAASERQVQAADPATSTWLSANAGSGKTRVLTDRVARLLLNGVEPQRILCLTYTKAAASEMQNRLFRRLGSWAMLPADRLRTELAALGVEGAPDDRDAGARRGACSRGRSRRRAACASRPSIPSARRCCGGFRWRRGCRRSSRELDDRAAGADARARSWRNWPSGLRRRRWRRWRGSSRASHWTDWRPKWRGTRDLLGRTLSRGAMRWRVRAGSRR